MGWQMPYVYVYLYSPTEVHSQKRLSPMIHSEDHPFRGSRSGSYEKIMKVHHRGQGLWGFPVQGLLPEHL